MCLPRSSVSCLRQFTVAAQYPHFSTLPSFTRPLLTDKQHYSGWKNSRLPFGPSTQFNKFQHPKLIFFSPTFNMMDNRETNMDSNCNSISASPTRRHPRESQPMSTRAKGKDKELRCDENDGEEGELSGRGSRGGRRVNGDKINALGRLMTAILRHRAENLGLNIRPDGYVPVDQLLKLRRKTSSGIPICSYTIDDVKEAVKNDNKQRFGLLEEKGQLYIRANQGHTIMAVETDKLLTPISSVEEVRVVVLFQNAVCVHGTYRKNLQSILKNGLKRMKRRHVHFAIGLPHDGDVISGMRGNAEILVYLDIEKAMKDGMKLYLSENKVLLTEGFNGVVPPQYFKNVETWPERKPVELSSDVKV